MLSSDSESRLIDRAIHGDATAVGELLKRYRHAVRTLIGMRIDRRMSARLDPSDVVQDALADASQRIDEFLANPNRPFYPWLRRIALDRLVDAYRAHVLAGKRSVLQEERPVLSINDDSAHELASHLAGSTASPASRIMRQEAIRRIRTALQDLLPHDRELLVMRQLEQLSVREIADVLGISESAVTTRPLRALQRLRRLLGDDLA